MSVGHASKVTQTSCPADHRPQRGGRVSPGRLSRFLDMSGFILLESLILIIFQGSKLGISVMNPLLLAPFVLALTCSIAMAAEAPAPPKKNDPNAPKPPAPSGLVGNALPYCDMGYYPAGNICKPAPPGFYAGASATYPVACPPGKTSNSGARGRSECF